MTCVVGWCEFGDVWLGSDSAGEDGYLKYNHGSKLIRPVPNIVIGYSGNVRQCQKILYSMPKWEDIFPFPEHFLFDWIPDPIETKDDEKDSYSMLIGVKGAIARSTTLYWISSSHAILDVSEVNTMADIHFWAIGNGSEVALGSMYSLARSAPKLNPMRRLEAALEASAKYISGVHPPFHYVSTEDNGKSKT